MSASKPIYVDYMDPKAEWRRMRERFATVADALEATDYHSDKHPDCGPYYVQDQRDLITRSKR